jgi:hypothetical protein
MVIMAEMSVRMQTVRLQRMYWRIEHYATKNSMVERYATSIGTIDHYGTAFYACALHVSDAVQLISDVGTPYTVATTSERCYNQ